jgi:hypothetical protein
VNSRRFVPPDNIELRRAYRAVVNAYKGSFRVPDALAWSRVQSPSILPHLPFAGHVPERRRRGHHHAVDIGAQRDRLVPFAEMGVGRMVDPVFLQVGRDLLLLGGIGFLGELIAQLLDTPILTSVSTNDTSRP